ncbi:hypothetical protein niasHT_033913 [Heterodera trifolii]|uniref:Uncharacterized protein n=1 Tax=Heterodera trifolii TaxID=157864 RepID=A0ABD2IDR9_9BILA
MCTRADEEQSCREILENTLMMKEAEAKAKEESFSQMDITLPCFNAAGELIGEDRPNGIVLYAPWRDEWQCSSSNNNSWNNDTLFVPCHKPKHLGSWASGTFH